jgi:hypothetical protein
MKGVNWVPHIFRPGASTHACECDLSNSNTQLFSGAVCSLILHKQLRWVQDSMANGNVAITKSSRGRPYNVSPTCCRGCNRNHAYSKHSVARPLGFVITRPYMVNRVSWCNHIGMCLGAKYLKMFPLTIKLHGLSPRANYTKRATAACRRSDCQLLRIEDATWSAWWILTAVFSVF